MSTDPVNSGITFLPVKGESKSVQARLLKLLGEAGSISYGGEKNPPFYMQLAEMLGDPTAQPHTIGTELSSLERLGQVTILRANGPRTATRLIRLATAEERDAALRRAEERSAKRVPKTKATKATKPDALAGLFFEVEPPAEQTQAAIDRAEAVYFKRMLMKVAEIDLHTFIQAVKAVG